MRIEKITAPDREIIALWRYENAYAVFNYALEKDGWLDLYCKDRCEHCFVAKEKEQIIGMFLFITQNENEFRLLINPKFLSKGYGKTVTTKALEMGFDTLSFKKISLMVRKNHPVAIKLYQKLGFNIVGEKTQLLNNEPIDFHIMSVQKVLSSKF